jgi:hypothetical protein
VDEVGPGAGQQPREGGIGHRDRVGLGEGRQAGRLGVGRGGSELSARAWLPAMPTKATETGARCLVLT